MACTTYEISDIDGRNKRTVTLEQYRAEVRAAVAKVKPIADAFYRGDLQAVANAQAQLRRAS